LQQTGPVSIIAPSIAIVGIMILRLLQTALITGLAIVTLSGCVYRMDIPQGNRIDPALVEQLEIGMSRNQVEFLLGTPSIVDLHHPDQWFYVFYLKTGDDGDIQKSVMTLTFTGNLLSMIDGDLNPG
jgi:outer membrane protein assembly factor BamE